MRSITELVLISLALLFASNISTFASSSRANIVSILPQYTSICKMIGGDFINVRTIITNKNSNPHNLQITAQYIRMIEKGDIIIMNGGNYDQSFITAVNNLKSNNKNFKANVINVYNLVKRDIKSTNPHIWFHPKTYQCLAIELHKLLSIRMPASKIIFDQNLATFSALNQTIKTKINLIKTKYCSPKKPKVFANEILLNLLLKELNCEILNEEIQQICHHGNEPSGKRIIELMNTLNDGNPEFFIVNSQVDNPLNKFIRYYSKQYQIPILNVTEILCQDINALEWQLEILDYIEKILSKNSTMPQEFNAS